jgi:hypothetical protein
VEGDGGVPISYKMPDFARCLSISLLHIFPEMAIKQYINFLSISRFILMIPLQIFAIVSKRIKILCID